LSIEKVGTSLRSKLRAVRSRQGSNKTLRSRFARVCVVVDCDDGHSRDPEWLLVEYPLGHSAPTKFVLSTLPASITCKQIVRTAKSRWRIERSYEDLTRELGLDHHGGRSFVGWHQHVSVVLACYALRVAEDVRYLPPRPDAKLVTTRSSTRPERHFHDSPITLRIVLVREKAVLWLPRCPCCLRDFKRSADFTRDAHRGKSWDQ
jgi:SRSO17 transposase